MYSLTPLLMHGSPPRRRILRESLNGGGLNSTNNRDIPECGGGPLDIVEGGGRRSEDGGAV